MRLRQIEVINAIMLTGSVSAAARLINVTQPAVSRTLQHAEIQLGFPLFQRAKNRLLPTDEALTLYPYIERLFSQLDEVQRLAINLRFAKDIRKLRLLVVPALCYDVLPKDVLHNSLRSVIARPRAVLCVAFVANSTAIGCKKTPCAPSRSAPSHPHEGYAGHP